MLPTRRVKHGSKCPGKVRRLALAAAAVCAGAAGCSPFAADDASSLREEVEAKTRGGREGEVDLRRVTFPWDRLYVFGPYTPSEDIERTLGFPWADAGDSALEGRDDINLLVFISGRQVIRAVEYPIADGDFQCLASVHRPLGFTRDQARFIVQQRGVLEGEKPYYLLAEAMPLPMPVDPARECLRAATERR